MAHRGFDAAVCFVRVHKENGEYPDNFHKYRFNSFIDLTKLQKNRIILIAYPKHPAFDGVSGFFAAMAL